MGAGSFGTAVAVLLARGGLRTTLQARTRGAGRAAWPPTARTRPTCPGVALPGELRVETVASRAVARRLRVPRRPVSRARGGHRAGWAPTACPTARRSSRWPRASCPPDGRRADDDAATRCWARTASRASAARPTRARWCTRAPASWPRRPTRSWRRRSRASFTRAGVVCERSNDPVGVELAGAAKNAAALASGATEAQGLNAAGAAAGHIFAEVWRFADLQGARPESLIGLAGTGDLVATALAPQSRNRRAGELLAAGVPAEDIPERIGQAIEALESVPLLARALERARVDAPVTSGLSRLISGELPLADWLALVRTTVPPPARWRGPVKPGFWRRAWARLRRRPVA